MEILVNIIICLISFLITVFIYSLGVVQILILIRMGFKQVKYDEDSGYIADYHTIRKSMRFTIVFWTSISIILICAVLLINNPFVSGGFLAALMIGALSSIGKTGMNFDNISDYYKTYSHYYINKDPININFNYKSNANMNEDSPTEFIFHDVIKNKNDIPYFPSPEIETFESLQKPYIHEDGSLK